MRNSLDGNVKKPKQIKIGVSWLSCRFYSNPAMLTVSNWLNISLYNIGLWGNSFFVKAKTKLIQSGLDVTIIVLKHGSNLQQS